MLFDKIDYDKIPELSKKMKSIFTQGRTVNTTAYLNWRFSSFFDMGTQFWQMAEGYFESANLLLNACLNDNNDKKADMNPEKISAVDMGYIFENLVQRFSESYDEEAGAHFTSRV